MLYVLINFTLFHSSYYYFLMHIKNLKKRTKIVYIICRIKFIGKLIIISFKSKAGKDQLFKFKKRGRE